MYKEINFVTNKIFQKNDLLSHWIINLALIRNDLLYSNEYAFNHFEREIELENGRFVNYFRIILAHYIEGMKFLAQSKDKPEISEFLEALDQENYDNPFNGSYQDRFAAILSSVDPYENSFIATKCLPMINATMGYSSNQLDVNKYIDRYEEGKIVIKGSRGQLIDLEFGDDCVTCIGFAHIEQDEIEIFCREISVKLQELMLFIENVIPRFIAIRSS